MASAPIASDINGACGPTLPPAMSSCRLYRVVYRVKDLKASIQFYTECLGMSVVEEEDRTSEKCICAVVGYGPPTSHFTVELRFYKEEPDFSIGTGFGHIGINVSDIFKSLALITQKGGRVIRDALQVKGASTICAFVEDPNGYEIELLQRNFTGGPLCQVMLRVVDFHRAIGFYEKVLGLKTLRTLQLEIAGKKLQLAFLGFGPEESTTVLELNSIGGVTSYEKGNAFVELIIGTDNIVKTLESIQAAGGEATLLVGEEGGPPSLLLLDLDGWKLLVVELSRGSNCTSL